ncbi:hypothetical protein EVC14_043 [Rhizobium phage RHph_I3_18]|nr:hypothetical protein EVC14_043 [Rhizobium phage RHph_I3_18]
MRLAPAPPSFLCVRINGHQRFIDQAESRMLPRYLGSLHTRLVAIRGRTSPHSSFISGVAHQIGPSQCPRFLPHAVHMPVSPKSSVSARMPRNLEGFGTWGEVFSLNVTCRYGITLTFSWRRKNFPVQTATNQPSKH